MKNFLLVFITVFTFNFAFSQDKIFLKSGDNIEVKILEINLNEVKYKKFSNLDGPIFTINKNNIHMVIYENGESEIFKETINKPYETSIVANTTTSSFKRNRINIEFIGYADLGPASVSYERLNESGKMGIEIPFNVHHVSEFNNEVEGFSTGVNFKFYPAGEGKWFFIGPSLALGFFDYYYYNYYYISSDTAFSVVPGAKIGSQFQITELFGLDLVGNAGYVIPVESNIDGAFAYSINFGFNFSL